MCGVDVTQTNAQTQCLLSPTGLRTPAQGCRSGYPGAEPSKLQPQRGCAIPLAARLATLLGLKRHEVVASQVAEAATLG